MNIHNKSLKLIKILSGFLVTILTVTLWSCAPSSPSRNTSVTPPSFGGDLSIEVGFTPGVAGGEVQTITATGSGTDSYIATLTGRKTAGLFTVTPTYKASTVTPAPEASYYIIRKPNVETLGELSEILTLVTGNNDEVLARNAAAIDIRFPDQGDSVNLFIVLSSVPLVAGVDVATTEHMVYTLEIVFEAPTPTPTPTFPILDPYTLSYYGKSLTVVRDSIDNTEREVHYSTSHVDYGGDLGAYDLPAAPTDATFRIRTGATEISAKTSVVNGFSTRTITMVLEDISDNNEISTLIVTITLEQRTIAAAIDRFLTKEVRINNVIVPVTFTPPADMGGQYTSSGNVDFYTAANVKFSLTVADGSPVTITDGTYTNTGPFTAGQTFSHTATATEVFPIGEYPMPENVSLLTLTYVITFTVTDPPQHPVFESAALTAEYHSGDRPNNANGRIVISSARVSGEDVFTITGARRGTTYSVTLVIDSAYESVATAANSNNANTTRNQTRPPTGDGSYYYSYKLKTGTVIYNVKVVFAPSLKMPFAVGDLTSTTTTDYDGTGIEISLNNSGADIFILRGVDDTPYDGIDPVTHTVTLEISTEDYEFVISDSDLTASNGVQMLTASANGLIQYFYRRKGDPFVSGTIVNYYTKRLVINANTFVVRESSGRSDCSGTIISVAREYVDGSKYSGLEARGLEGSDPAAPTGYCIKITLPESYVFDPSGSKVHSRFYNFPSSQARGDIFELFYRVAGAIGDVHRIKLDVCLNNYRRDDTDCGF